MASLLHLEENSALTRPALSVDKASSISTLSLFSVPDPSLAEYRNFSPSCRSLFAISASDTVRTNASTSDRQRVRWLGPFDLDATSPTRSIAARRTKMAIKKPATPPKTANPSRRNVLVRMTSKVVNFVSLF